MRGVAMVLTTLAVASDSLAAQDRELPPIIPGVLEAYRTVGARGAVGALARAALFPVDSTESGPLLVQFVKIEATYGRMVGYDLVRDIHVGEHLRQTYFVILHERGPAFWEFVSYHAPERWRFLAYRFDTDPRKVLPPDMWPQPAVPQQPPQ